METVKADVTVSVGAPRTGKTSEMAFEISQDRSGKNLVVEPPFSICPKIIAQRVAQHKDQTVFLDMLGWTKKTAAYVNLYESSSIDQLQKDLEDRIIRDDFMWSLFGERNLDPTVNVLIEERIDEATRLLQLQKSIEPVWWLSQITRFNSRFLGTLLAGCHHRETREDIEAWFQLTKPDWRRELGPMARILKPLADPSVVSRCGDVDPLDIISRYNTILISGEGATADAISFFAQYWVNAGIRWVETYRQPLRITVDEAALLGRHMQGVFSNRLLNAARLYAKYGLSFSLAIHSPFAVEESIRQQLFDMASVIKVFRINEPESVSLMGKMLALPNLNPNKVAYYTETEKSLPNGYEEVEVRSIKPGAIGIMRPDKSEGFEEWSQGYDYAASDIRKDKRLITTYERKIERTPHYRSLGDQATLTAQDIVGLPRQCRGVWENGHSYFGMAPDLVNPFVFDSCLEKRVRDFVQRMLEREDFQFVEVKYPTGRPWQRATQSDKSTKKK